VQGEQPRLLAGAALLGFSVSVDELAVGFGAGLLRLPIVPLAIAVGAQAFIVTQLGLWLGGRVSERLGELAERFAGAALLALGAVLAAERLAA
jgi:putative Mn2+ efflux pump MntP